MGSTEVNEIQGIIIGLWGGGGWAPVWNPGVGSTL